MSRRFFLFVLSIAMIATGALAPAPAAATTAPCTLETFDALNLPETTITLSSRCQRDRTRRPSATSPFQSVG